MISSNFEYFGDKWVSELNLIPQDKEAEEYVKKTVNMMKKSLGPPFMSAQKDKTYVRYKDGVPKEFIPSEPGFPPNTNWGDLKDSIGYTKLGQSKYEIYTDSEYAPFLEFGAPGSNLLPRPFFYKAVLIGWTKYMNKKMDDWDKKLAEGKTVRGYSR